MKLIRNLVAVATVPALLAATGCGTADVGTDEMVSASFSLTQGSSVVAGVELAFSSDSGPGPIRPGLIDSLIVTVRRVEVLPSRRLHRCHPPVGDSVIGFRPQPGRGPGGSDDPVRDGEGAPRGFDDGHRGPPDFGCGRGGPGGPLGPGGGRPEHPPERPDSMDTPPDSGWGSRPWHWFSLAVTGNGRIDLLDLPTDSTDGIVLAAGNLPAGEYVAARLIVTSATIWFNTEIVADSFTLKPDTGYSVQLPHRRQGPMGILTRSGFTVPDNGGDVLLLFDPDLTIGHAVVTANGTILIRPVLHQKR